MKRFITLFLLFTTSAYAQDYPLQAGFVNDYANLLSVDEEHEIATKLKKLQDNSETKIEFIVATIPSLKGKTVEQYANGLAKEWHVGKPDGFGVLLLVAPKDRKVRFEISDQLNYNFSSAEALVIIQNDVLPFFKSKQLNLGIIHGVDEALKKLNAVRVEPTIEEPPRANAEATPEIFVPVQTADVNSNDIAFFFLFLFVLGAIVAAIFLFIKRSIFQEERVKMKKAIKTAISELKYAYGHLKELQDIASKEVWNNFDTQLLNCDSNQLEAELEKATTFFSSYRLHNVKSMISSWNICFQTIEKKLEEVKKIKNNFSDNVNLLAEYVHSIREGLQTEVTEATKDLAVDFIKDYDQAKQKLSEVIKEDKTNWIGNSKELSGLSNRAKSIIGKIEKDNELASTAKVEGPKLLESLKARLDKLEKRDSKKGKQARTQYSTASTMASAGGNIDWLNVYLLLNTVSSLCNSPEPVSRSSSSYSTGGYSGGSSTPSYDYGSSSSDSGGGGFDSGGGSSSSWGDSGGSFDSGGGASGDW